MSIIHTLKNTTIEYSLWSFNEDIKIAWHQDSILFIVIHLTNTEVFFVYVFYVLCYFYYKDERRKKGLSFKIHKFVILFTWKVLIKIYEKNKKKYIFMHVHILWIILIFFFFFSSFLWLNINIYNIFQLCKNKKPREKNM